MKMNSSTTSNIGSYFINSADFCTIGNEWNSNDWDAKNNPTGYHALYYRTDNGSGRAFLHMLDGVLELFPNKVYFIPAYSVLRSEIHGEIQKYYIHFDSDFSNIGLQRHLLKKCSVNASGYTKDLFDIILRNYKNKTASAEQKVFGAINILLADLSEKLLSNLHNTEKFEPVLQFIENNYDEKITIDGLAKLINLSTVYFSNLFTSTFHISPKQYILSRRLFEAKRLLSDTDLSITEIAKKVGFDNANYFSEIFSQKIGTSPLSFRKSTPQTKKQLQR